MTPIRFVAVCHRCKMQHLVHPGSDEGIEFLARHQEKFGCSSELVPLTRRHIALVKLWNMLKVDTFKLKRAFDKRDWAFGLAREGFAGYSGNANVKEAFGTTTAFTIANANLTNSATGGWKSNSVDNTTNLYDDYLMHWVLAAVNTAPANAKAVMCYAHTLVDDTGTAYTSTGDGTPDGSEGTLTFPDYTTLPVSCPMLGAIPYPVQNRALNGGPFSHARAFGQVAGPKLVVSMINHTGMTLSVTSISYRGVYYTVA